MTTDQVKQPLRYIMYLRKSSEDEDRQAASLPSQFNELDKLAKREHLNVVEIFREEKSAHTIGRPDFNKMVEMIDQGKANAILVWHLNRVARNALDGGMIIYLLDTQKILEIRTVSSKHDGSGNDKLMLQIEFAMSKKYSDDLSDIVKRGNKQKFFERHEWPGLAKPGYRNIQDQFTKVNKIEADPDRFPLLQQAMKLIISGENSISEAYHKLTEEWGYKTPLRRKRGDCKLYKSAFYKILRDPFYYGWMVRKEGETMGTHQAMLTKQEFQRLQARIGGWHKNKSEIDLPYRGLLKCGECGSAIVGQEKWQIICSACKHKFHRGNKLQCPKCGIKIEEMKDYKLLHYIYYGCTRKKNPNCSQHSLVEIKDIEKQIDTELQQYEIPEDFKNWAITYLNEIHDDETYRTTIVADNLSKQLKSVVEQKNQLLKLKISPNNSKGELISEDEYSVQRKGLIDQEESLEEQIKNLHLAQNEYMELTEKTFDFACYARYWFERGDAKTKSLILKSLGYNLTLEGKKIGFISQKPFYLIRKTYEGIHAEYEKLEPEKKIGLSINYGLVPDINVIMSG